MTDQSDPFQALDEPIRQSLAELGWTAPTPVQEKVLPAMRTGRDLIVQAQRHARNYTAMGRWLQRKGEMLHGDGVGLAPGG